MRGRVPMMVSIRAPSVMAEQREPVDIVVVLHVRAGCKVPGYWQDLLMEAVQVVTSKLRDEDRLSVIPSGGTTRVSEDPEQRLTVKYMEALLPMSDKNKELYSDALSKAIQKCDNPLVRALEMADSILYGQSYENAEERRAGYIIVISNNADDMGSFLTWRFRSVLAFGFRDVHNARTMHTIARSRDSTYAILDDEHGVISQAFSSSVDRIISAVTAMPVEVRLRCCEQKEVTLLGVDGPHISYFISYDKKEIWASAYLYGVVTNFIVYLSLGVGDHRDQVLHKNDLRDRFTVLHVKHRHVQGMLDGQVVTVYNGIDGSKEVAAEIVRIEAVKIVAEFTKGDKSDSEELHKASDELCAQWTNLYRNREATEAGDLISGLAAEMKEMEIRLYNNYLWLEYMLSWKSHQWWQLPLPRLFMDKQDQVVGDSLVRLTIFAKVDTISGTTNVTESQQQLQSQKKQWSQQQDNVSGTVTESKQEEEQQQQQQHQHKQDIVAATVTKSQQQREPQKQHQQQQDNVTKSQPQQDTVSGTVKESQQQHEPQKQQEEEEDNVEGTVTKSEQQQQQPQQQQNQQQQRQQQEDIVSRTVTGSQQQQQLKQRPQKQQQEEQRQQRLPVLVRIVAPETGLAKVKRAPVDLVVVMDASWGATEVEKKSKIRMEQLTEAMELIIEKLSHKDRLAIVPVDVQSSSSLPEHASRLLVMSKQGKSKVQSLVNQVVSKSPLAPADNKVELPLPMQTTHWREKVNKAMELIKKRLHIAPVNSTSDPTPTTSSQSQRRSYWTSETSVPEPTAELRTVEGGPPHRQPIYIPRNNRFNLARNNRFDLAHLPPGVSPESPNFDPPIPFAHPTHWPKLRRPEHRQLSTEGGHGSTILGEALADAMQILKHAEETNQEDRPGFIIVISNSVENISMNSKHTVHAFSFYNSDTRNTRAMHDIASGSGIYGSLHDRRDQISQAFTVCINKITSTIGVKTTVHISWSHSSSIALSAIQSGKLDYRIDKDKKSGTIWAGALHAGTVKNFMLYLDNVREEDHVNLSKMLQVRVEWLEAFDGTKEKLDGQVVIVKEEDEGFMEVMAQMARAEAGKIVGEIAHPRYDMVGDRLSKCLEAAKKAREAGDASLAREMEMMKTLLLRKLERMAGRGSMEVLEGIITVDPHYVRKLVEDRLSYMLSWLSFQDLCLNKHPGCHNF